MCQKPIFLFCPASDGMRDGSLSAADSKYRLPERMDATLFSLYTKCLMLREPLERAPHGGEPRLLGSRTAGRPEVVLDELEARRCDEAAPGLEREVGAVAQTLLTLDVRAVGVAAEEYASRHQRSAKVVEHPAELLCRHVKKNRIREDAVEPFGRQRKGQEVLMPDFAAGCGPRHGHESGRTVESHRRVAVRHEGGDVASRSAAEIEDALRGRSG